MSTNHNLVRVAWECPLCGAHQSSIQQAVNESRGRNGLLNHIRHTADEDHGDWRALPESLSRETLQTCLTVEPIALGISESNGNDGP
jgi:hypothetical protein